MKVNDQEGWDACVKKNADPYGAGVIRFSQRWAELMEECISNGKQVAEVAQSTSHEADTEGITGFMYGCAVSILSKYWTHGEELRQWHNLDTQIGSEGEVSNQRGGVLNPAVIGYSPKS